MTDYHCSELLRQLKRLNEIQAIAALLVTKCPCGQYVTSVCVCKRGKDTVEEFRCDTCRHPLQSGEVIREHPQGPLLRRLRELLADEA